MSDISVLGIFVADISFSGPKIPAIGETILGNKYNVGPGGKGCNQAVAIARLGAKVNFISKIGKDYYGELALNTLTCLLYTSPSPRDLSTSRMPSSA